MAGYVIGIGVLTFTAWQLWSHRRVPGAVEITGTVIEEVSRKSTKTGRRTLLYAPRVSYEHPRTGRREIYEPTAFGSVRFGEGQQTPLLYDPSEDRLYRPLDRPVRDTVVLSLVGVGFIVAQVLDGR